MNTTASTRKLPRFVMASVIAAAASLFAPAIRAASNEDQAEALIHEGVQLRAQDQAAKALPMFEKAYQVARTPRTAAQLGLCELELKSYVEAERHLTEALASPDHPWIAKNKPVLKHQLETARENIGELALTISPIYADVSLNGKPVDSAMLGAPIRVNKGPVELQVRAAGYQTSRETITIAGGKREQRRVALVAEPPKAVVPPPIVQAPVPVAPPPAPASTTTATASATLIAAPSPSPDTGGPSHPARSAAWITGGVAAGALVFGTVEAFSAKSKSDAFNNHTGALGGAPYQDCGTANLSPACKPLKDAYDRALTLSLVGFATAGALAVTSSVLFVLSSSGHAGSAESTGAPHAFACVPDVGVRGVGCALRF